MNSSAITARRGLVVTPARRGAFATMVGCGLGLSVVAVVITCAVMAGEGSSAAVDAAIGGGGALAFLVSGWSGVRLVLRGHAAVGLAGAMTVVLVQTCLFLGLFKLIRTSGWVHEPSHFAAGALTCAFAWQIGHIVGALRSRTPVFVAGAEGGS